MKNPWIYLTEDGAKRRINITMIASYKQKFYASGIKYTEVMMCFAGGTAVTFSVSEDVDYIDNLMIQYYGAQK